MDKAERLERVQIDVDTRLADVWAMAWDVFQLNDENSGPFAALIRAAYACGYRDALREDDEGRRGELARANGYTKGEGA